MRGKMRELTIGVLVLLSVFCGDALADVAGRPHDLSRGNPQGHCINCHDLHQVNLGQGFPHNLKRANEMQVCYQCHAGALNNYSSIDPSLPDPSVLESRYDIRAEFSQPHIHFPTNGMDGEINKCSFCHNPHGVFNHDSSTRLPKLLSAGPDAVTATDEYCFSCHNSDENPPHGKFPNITVAARYRLSRNIYRTMTHSTFYRATTLDEPVPDTAGTYDDNPYGKDKDVSCLTCHRPHGSSHDHMLKSADDETFCLTCHDGSPAGDLTTFDSSGHGKAGVGRTCQECHFPHGTGQENAVKTLIEDPHTLRNMTCDIGALGMNEACLACHTQASANKYYSGKSVYNAGIHKISANAHNPRDAGGDKAAGECGNCHDPHGKDSAKMLVVSGETLCFDCHNETTPNTASGRDVEAAFSMPSHHDLAKVKCVNCHNVHKATQASYLMDPYSAASVMTDKKALCAACHGGRMPAGVTGAPDISAELTGKGHDKTHILSCPDCHESHGSPNPHNLGYATRVYGGYSARFMQGMSFSSREYCEACHKRGAAGYKSAKAIPTGAAYVSQHEQSDATPCSDCHRLRHNPTLSSYTGASAYYTAACLNCHKTGAGNPYPNPDADFNTPAIPGDLDSYTSIHDITYNTTNPDCVKCHGPNHEADHKPANKLKDPDPANGQTNMSSIRTNSNFCMECHDSTPVSMGGRTAPLMRLYTSVPLLNGGFEDASLNGWSQSGSGLTAAKDTAVYRSGGSSARLTNVQMTCWDDYGNPYNCTEYGFLTTQSYQTAQPSASYTLSAYVRIDTAFPSGTLALRVIEYNSSGSYLTESASAGVGLTTGWQKLTYTWTTNAGTGRVYFGVVMSGLGTAYLDDFESTGGINGHDKTHVLICSDCHEYHRSQNGKLINYVPKVLSGYTAKFRTGLAFSSREFCEACHRRAGSGYKGAKAIPTGAGYMAQHDQEDPAACSSCHSNKHNPSIQPSYYTAACLDCHKAGTGNPYPNPDAEFNTPNAPGDLNVYTSVHDITYNTTDPDCVKCHGSSHEVDHRATYKVKDPDPANGWSNMSSIRLRNYFCLECHDTTPVSIGGRTPVSVYYPWTNQGHDATHVMMCRDCHAYHGSLNRGLLNYNKYVQGGYSANFRPGLKFTDRAFCETCHNRTGLGYRNKAKMIPTGAQYMAQHDQSDATPCSDCHRQKHNPRLSSYTGSSKYYTAACLDCHKQGTGNPYPYPDAEFNTPDVPGDPNGSKSVHDITYNTTNPDCVKCHGSNHEVDHRAAQKLKDPDTANGQSNMSSIRTKNTFCLECHDATPVTIGGMTPANIIGTYTAAGHGTAAGGGKLCIECHSHHGSTNVKLIKAAINGRTVMGHYSGNNSRVCAACHLDQDAATPKWPGYSIYSGSIHAYGNPTTGNLVVYGQHGPGACVNCHNPHGAKVSGKPTNSMLYSNQEELCYLCHNSATPNTASGEDVQSRFAMRTHHNISDTDQKGPDGIAGTADDSKIECEDCHDPHTITAKLMAFDERSGVVIPVAADQEFCIKCHNGSVPEGVDYPDEGVWDKHDYTNSAHGNHLKRIRTFGNYSNGVTYPCKVCHHPHGSEQNAQQRESWDINRDGLPDDIDGDGVLDSTGMVGFVGYSTGTKRAILVNTTAGIPSRSGFRRVSSTIPVQANGSIDVELCLNCHDGSPAYDVRTDFKKRSHHPVEYDQQVELGGAKIECYSCHDQHRAQATNEAANEYATTNPYAPREPMPGDAAFCLKCHDNTLPPGISYGDRSLKDIKLSYNPTGRVDANGYDVISSYRGHFRQSDGEPMMCRYCHNQHGSAYTNMLRDNTEPGKPGHDASQPIQDMQPVALRASDPLGGGDSDPLTSTTEHCLACHSGKTTYNGEPIPLPPPPDSALRGFSLPSVGKHPDLKPDVTWSDQHEGHIYKDTFAVVTSADMRENCAFCHDSHNPYIATISDELVDCYQCHNENTSLPDTQSEFNDNPTDPAHSVSIHPVKYDPTGTGPDKVECLKCHDQTLHMQGTVRLRKDPSRFDNYPTDGDVYADPITSRTINAFCLTCHEQGSTKSSNFNRGGTRVPQALPAGSSGAHFANGNLLCTDCHEYHASNKESLRDKEKGDQEKLCYSCHNDPAKSANFVNIMSKFTSVNSRHDVDDAAQSANGSKVECESCHNPHTATRAMPVADQDDGTTPVAADDAFCVSCHDSDGAQDVKFPGFATGTSAAEWSPATGVWNKWNKKGYLGYTSTHRKEAVGCKDCHDPHGDRNHAMLLANVSATTGIAVGYGVHSTARGKRTEEIGVNAVCAACHKGSVGLYPGYASFTASTFGHKKGIDKNCTYCHNPHGSAQRDMMRSDKTLYVKEYIRVPATNCVKLVSSLPGDSYFKGSSISATASTQYTLSAWVYIPVELTGGNATLRVQEYYVSGWVPVLGTDSTYSPGVTVAPGWQKMDFTFTTASNTTSLYPLLQVNGAGTAYYDDITLIKAGTQDNLCAIGSFETSLTGWTATNLTATQEVRTQREDATDVGSVYNFKGFNNKTTGSPYYSFCSSFGCHKTTNEGSTFDTFNMAYHNEPGGLAVDNYSKDETTVSHHPVREGVLSCMSCHKEHGTSGANDAPDLRANYYRQSNWPQTYHSGIGQYPVSDYPHRDYGYYRPAQSSFNGSNYWEYYKGKRPLIVTPSTPGWANELCFMCHAKDDIIGTSSGGMTGANTNFKGHESVAGGATMSVDISRKQNKLGTDYHNFSCSQCHYAHVSRKGKLLRRSCMSQYNSPSITAYPYNYGGGVDIFNCHSFRSITNNSTWNTPGWRDVMMSPAKTDFSRPPNRVTDLAVDVLDQTQLTAKTMWTPVLDYSSTAIHHYNVYRHTQQITQENLASAARISNKGVGGTFSDEGGRKKFVDDTCQPNTTYWYAVVACDAANNESFISNSVQAALGPDTLAPNRIANQNITRPDGTNNVYITWGDPGDNVNVAKYKIYRKSSTAGPVSPLVFADVTGITNWKADVNDTSQSSTGGGDSNTYNWTDTSPSADPDKWYAYAVVAVDAANKKSDVPTASVFQVSKDATAPGRVTQTITRTDGTNNVTITWRDPGDNLHVRYYKVYKKASASPLAALTDADIDAANYDSVYTVNDTQFTGGTADPTTYTYNDNSPNADPDRYYAYAVCAFDWVGNRSLVPTANQLTLAKDTTAPNRVTQTITRTSGTNNVTITWRDPGDNLYVKQYKVYKKASATGAVAALTDADINSANYDSVYTVNDTLLTGGTADPTTYTYNDNSPNADPDKWYAYAVCAFDWAGNRSLVPTANQLTLAKDTSAPTAISDQRLAQAALSPEVTVTWHDPGDNLYVKEYRIYRRDGVSPLTETDLTPENLKQTVTDSSFGPSPDATNYSWLDNTTVVNTSYAYAVVAYDWVGNKSLPTGVDRTINVLDPAPLPVTMSTPAPVSAQAQAQLSWTQPSSYGNDVIGYYVYRKAGSALTQTDLNNTANRAAPGVITGLTYTDNVPSTDTTYYYAVTAVDGSSSRESALGNTLSAYIPGPPGGFAAYRLAESAVQLSWDAPAYTTDLGTYKVWMRRDGGAWSNPSSITQTSTSLNLAGQQPGTYDFAVSSYYTTYGGVTPYESTKSQVATIIITDTAGPGTFTVGGALSELSNRDSVALTWSAPSDTNYSGSTPDGVEGYRVQASYDDGATWATVFRTELSNPGFETHTGTADDGTADAFSGWTATNTSAYAVTDALFDTKAVKIKTTGTGTHAISSAGTAGASVANRKYTMSFWAKSNKPATFQYQVQANGGNNETTGSKSSSVTPVWRNYTTSGTFTAGATATSAFAVIMPSTDSTVEVTVDGVRLGDASAPSGDALLKNDGSLFVPDNGTSPGTPQSFDDPKVLTPNTKAQYRVQALDYSGNRSATATSSYVASRPRTITDLSVASSAATTANVLTFGASASQAGLSRYDIYAKEQLAALTSYDGATLIGTTDLASLTFTHDQQNAYLPAVTGHTYAYAVKAVDINGTGSNISSGPATVKTTADKDAPDRVIDLSVESPVGTTDAVLQWTVPQDNNGTGSGTTSYKLYQIPKDTLGTAAPVTDANLASALVYTGTYGSGPGTVQSRTVSWYDRAKVYYAVSSGDAAGNWTAVSNSPEVIIGKDIELPQPPSVTECTPLESPDVYVAWNPATDNVGINGYRLYRADANTEPFLTDGCINENNVTLAQLAFSLLPYNATSAVDGGGTPGQRYYYAVQAWDDEHNYSNISYCGPETTATVALSGADDHNPPAWQGSTPLSASAGEYPDIDLAWTGAVDAEGGIDHYKIYRSQASFTDVNSPGVERIAAVAGTRTSYIDRMGYHNTTYYYRITAMDTTKLNTGALSNEVSATVAPAPQPDNTPPTMPGSFAASTGVYPNVNLSWTASSDPGNAQILCYRLYKAVSPTQITDENKDDPLQVETTMIANDAAAYAMKGIGGTTYNIRLEALDMVGNASGMTPQVAATVAAAPVPDTTAPTMPGSFAITVGPSPDLNLSWTASSDTNNQGNPAWVDHYNIYKAQYEITADNIGTITPIIAAGSQTTYTDSSGQPNTRYWYSICAVDSAGNLSAKVLPSVSATTAADTMPPAAINDLEANVSGDTVRLTWCRPSDNARVDHYEIYRKAQGSILTDADVADPANRIATYYNTGVCLAYEDEGRPSGSYAYAVIAVDGAGNRSTISSGPVTVATVP